MTEVARESISVAGNIASDFVSSTASLPQFRSSNRPNSIQLIKKASNSNRSLPADATTTCINIDSNGSASDPPNTKVASQSSQPSESLKENESNANLTADEYSTLVKEDTGVQDPEATENTPTTIKPETEPGPNGQASTTWFGWLGLSKTVEEKPGPEERDMGKSPDRDEPLPASIQEAQTSNTSDGVVKGNEEHGSANVAQKDQRETNDPVPPKRSWMQMWGATTAIKAKEDSQDEISVKEPRLQQDQNDDQAASSMDIDQADKPQGTDPRKRISGSGKSGGWAFWSREVSSTEQEHGSEAQQETGELVVSDQPKVQSKPEDIAAQVDKVPSSTATAKSQQKSPKKGSKSIDMKSTQSNDLGKEVESSTLTTQASTAQVPAKVQTPAVTASTKLESVLTNQVLPSFKDTFALQESPSWLQTLGRMIYSPKDSGNQHVFALRDPPRPKKALAIGVHGYFPAPYLRTVLGQPTGTSLKFSTMAAKAIHQWTERHGYQCDVEKIALEGEGRIAERVDLLWKLLLRWIEEIRKAEFIMFACHSQGVPVTIMLVAKLIAFGCLDAARVGICAMAGVNLGPFPDYKSRFIGGSAGELFDFAHPTTKVSKDYEAALKTVLDFGARISYIGSIDDQLVSLEVCCPFLPFVTKCLFELIICYSHHCLCRCLTRTYIELFLLTEGFMHQACKYNAIDKVKKLQLIVLFPFTKSFSSCRVHFEASKSRHQGPRSHTRIECPTCWKSRWW